MGEAKPSVAFLNIFYDRAIGAGMHFFRICAQRQRLHPRQSVCKTQRCRLWHPCMRWHRLNLVSEDST